MNALKGMGMVAVLAGLLAVAPTEAEAKKAVEGVVNLNTATASDLERLPGIGPSTSARIIAYRQTRPFKRVEELVRVKGIGRKTLAKLRPHLTVEGPTTVKSVGKTSSGKKAKKATQAKATQSRSKPRAVRKASGPPRVAQAPAFAGTEDDDAGEGEDAP